MHYGLGYVIGIELKYLSHKLEIEPERLLVLFLVGISLLLSGLGTFSVPVQDHAKHFP